MTRLLQIDASARAGRSDLGPHGSHTRRLTARFVGRWLAARPREQIVRRDLGRNPPSPVNGDWIHAAFTPPAARAPWMHGALAESDALVDELIAADVIVAGVPMYNFNVPAQFKAYIDQVVRVGRTFGFDRTRPGVPYWPLLGDRARSLVILTSRGDFGYADRQQAMNHVEPSIRTAFGYIGISNVTTVAIEYDEFGGKRLHDSIQRAEADIDALVDRLLQIRTAPRERMAGPSTAG